MKDPITRFAGSVSLVLFLLGCGPENETIVGDKVQRVVAADADQLAYPEYDLNVPVGSWWMHDASASTVQNKIDEGYRLTDIEYLPNGNFTATFVLNTGVYEREGAGWDFDLTDAELHELVVSSSNRVVDIARRGTGANTRWAVAWVSNTGSQARAYKVVTNRTQANFQAEGVGFRVMSLTIGADGSYNSVLIENTGADARTQTFFIGTSDLLRQAMEADQDNCRTGPTPCGRAAAIAAIGPDQFYVVFEDRQMAPSIYSNANLVGEGEQTWLVGNLQYLEGAYDRPDSLEHAFKRLAGRPTKLKLYTDQNGNARYMAIVVSNGTPPRGGDLASDNTTTQELDALIEQQARQAGLPGLTVGIMRDGQLVHAKGYGYRDMQSNETLLPTDSLRIASVSKRIAKAAILRLIEENALIPGTSTPLTLNTTPFGTLFPYNAPSVSPNLGDVTIEHLLDHTSGLRFDNQGSCGDTVADTTDQWCNPFEWEMQAQDWIDTEAAVQAATGIAGGAFYLNDGTVVDPATPGTTFRYRNAHYHMLGHVIEAMTGMEFEEYVRLEFLDPLNLDGLRIGRLYGDAEWPDATQAANYARLEFSATGSSQNRGDWVLDNPARYPASSYASSPVDILRWQASLEGTAPGYRGLQDYSKMGDVVHNGYLPDVTIAQIDELTVGGSEYTYFWATSSDAMNNGVNPFGGFLLDAELQGFITAKGALLPNRDLFEDYLDPPCFAAFHNLPVESYQACFDYHSALGLTPKTLTVSTDGQRISGAFEPGNRRTHHLISGEVYNGINLEELDKNSVPVFTNVVNSGSGPLFTATWESSPGDVSTWWNLTPSEYEQKWEEHFDAGYLQTDFFPYNDGGLKFASTWRALPSDGYASYFNILPDQWAAFDGDFVNRGLKLTHFVAYLDGGQLRYGGIWEKVPGSYVLTIDDSGAGYQATFDARVSSGWQLHHLHSFGSDSFAAIWYQPAEGAGILSFEDPNLWSKVQGPGLVGGSDWGTHGNSLSLSSGGFTEIVSPWLSTSAIRDHSPSGSPSQATLDVYVPSQQPNSWWVGAIQLHIEIPSQNIHHAFQGQVELTSLARGQFTTVHLPLAGVVQAALQTDATDVRFYITTNTPIGADSLLLDHLRFTP